MENSVMVSIQLLKFVGYICLYSLLGIYVCWVYMSICTQFIDGDVNY